MIATLGLQALYEPLMTYIHPRVFQAWERKGGEEARRLLGRYLGLYAACGLVMSVLFLVAEPWLIRAVANSSYALEPAVFAGLLLSSYLLGLYRLLATNYLLTKRTGELALSYFVASRSTCLPRLPWSAGSASWASRGPPSRVRWSWPSWYGGGDGHSCARRSWQVSR